MKAVTKKHKGFWMVVVVQSLSHVPLFVTLLTAAHQASLSHHQLLAATQTHVHWVGDIIQPSHPLSSPSPPALSLSQHQGLFQWVSSSHQVARVLELQLQHVLPMNLQDWCPLELTGWISLQSKGLSRLLQQHTSKASILQRSAFFTVQLSHPHMTTGKTTALTGYCYECYFIDEKIFSNK